MGKNSPSRYRKEGRLAYEPGLDPEEECPYSSQEVRESWIEGWNTEALMQKADAQMDRTAIVCPRCGSSLVDHAGEAEIANGEGGYAPCEEWHCHSCGGAFWVNHKGDSK